MLTQFVRPGFPVQEKAAARQGRTRLRQFACPAQPVQKKGAAQNGRTACAVRASRKAGAL